ncbi:hypothetical protein CK203_117524 [Vitis vinifera]|uniref:Xylanase inhibitor C-terminal domain-containing protein n=1 Tax=Vitis vinifera TaxID=29760 RepID=A0A438CSN0_VITVI|nr:hypothetical protein CK203_117524 [Vitis vinifera]
MERPRTGITPLIDISSLLPKNNCSAPAGDSGPVVTRLPTAAYEALRTAFQQEMLHCPSIPPPPPEKLLDTCYNLKGCGGET